MMAHSLLWLPEVLKNAGLKVAPVPGWETRSRSDMGQIAGVICHHTVGRRSGIMPSLNTLINGTSSIAGPLSQLGLGRDGTFFIVAAGKCSHAGTGAFRGITSGNTHFIGIEAENTGGTDDFPWPEIQMDAYRRGVAAILKHVGSDIDFCIGHKEWALPVGRKPDPSFDMNRFRIAVSDILDGIVTPPRLIPAIEPVNGSGRVPRRTIRRGDEGELVKEIQLKLQLEADGKFGPKTEAAMRAFQRSKQLVPDGIVGPKTWVALDGL